MAHCELRFFLKLIKIFQCAMHQCSNFETYLLKKSNISHTTKHLLHLIAHVLAKSRSINYRANGLSSEYEQYCLEKGFTYVKIEDDIGRAS